MSHGNQTAGNFFTRPDSGNLVLRATDTEPAPGAEYSDGTSIDLETGSLVLFPSSLLHHTIPFEVEIPAEHRIMLAFNMMPAD